jgi:hypothetical protein
MDERFQRLQDDVDIGINCDGGNTKKDREFKTKNFARTSKPYTSNINSSEKGDIVPLFFKTLVVVLIINQVGYGFCFFPYCIIAALPKVIIISAVITGLIWFIRGK